MFLFLFLSFCSKSFTKNDENFVEAFAIFCGMGIHNTHMYEKAIVAMAKQSVTLEVLSYHASASMDDAGRLRVYLSCIFILFIDHKDEKGKFNRKCWWYH